MLKPLTLETGRLTLIPCTPAQLLALIDNPASFEQTSGLSLAAGLAAFYSSPDVSPAWVAKLRSATTADPWRHGFFLYHRAKRSIIGTAGFKGPPDADGMVEIAYGVAPSFEGQGYATEAAGALVDFAARSKDVRLIRAHTLPEPNASTRVLLKNGFHHCGAVVDPEDGPVWRWERAPNAR